VIRITDGDLAVSVDPDFGNNAFSFTARGHEILWKPEGWPKPALGGIPLLAPWANRIDGDAYFANGQRYLLNASLENLRYDGNHLPIHGLLAFAGGWKIVAQDAASVTSRLEFWRFPRWMAQFPFAHAIEITHRLRGGSLEVATAIENLSVEPMPLCVGYHPYFQLSDSPREEWLVHLAAREQVTLSEKLVPTGEKRPIGLPNPFPLSGAALDHVFTGLTGADFVLQGRTQRIAVHYGEKFPVAIVYAPSNGSFVCFEPMTALTNAFNLDHAGVAAGLQHIAPGQTWRESFRITPAGFTV
jgi:aldose 1-epimerase